MTLEFRQVGTGHDVGHKKLEQSMHQGPNRLAGAVAYTIPFDAISPEGSIAFVDSNGSGQINVNVTFAGTPEGIHNGGDTALWTASAISGTWDFASTTNPNSGSACIDATSTQNNAEALFEDGTSTDFSNFTALTGFIRLEAFGSGNDVELRFRLNGVDVGNSVSLMQFINTGLLNSYQKFAINKSVFGISTQTVDELVVKTIKITGSPPDYRLDDIQIEETGVPVQFEVRPIPGTEFHVREIVFIGRATSTNTLANASIPRVDSNEFFGITALTVGTVVTVKSEGLEFEGINFKRIFDLLADAGGRIGFVGSNSDGTQTTIQFILELNDPIILRDSTDDFWRITVNDDLSSLLDLEASASGLIINDIGISNGV